MSTRIHGGVRERCALDTLDRVTNLVYYLDQGVRAVGLEGDAELDRGGVPRLSQFAGHSNCSLRADHPDMVQVAKPGATERKPDYHFWPLGNRVQLFSTPVRDSRPATTCLLLALNNWTLRHCSVTNSLQGRCLASIRSPNDRDSELDLWELGVERRVAVSYPFHQLFGKQELLIELTTRFTKRGY